MYSPNIEQQQKQMWFKIQKNTLKSSESTRIKKSEWLHIYRAFFRKEDAFFLLDFCFLPWVQPTDTSLRQFGMLALPLLQNSYLCSLLPT
ncbi:MAG: hypothetical protein ACPG49_09230 [Chitinophagales bacterium]